MAPPPSRPTPSTPPKDPIRPVIQLDDLGLNEPPRRNKRKKAVLLIDRIYRAMFVVGMIIGAFLTLLLPLNDYTVSVAEYSFTIPFSVLLHLEYWQRWLVYVVMVIANGFFWARVAVNVCEKHFPQTRRVSRNEEEVSSLGSKIWRLDTPSDNSD